MKKKIFCFVIFIILICAFTVVHAADNSVTVSIDNNNKLKKGDTFKLTVSASNNAGLNGIDATVEYDKNILELIESKLVDTSNWSEYDSFPKLTALWKTASSETKTANIYEVTFKVKEDSGSTTNVKLKEIMLSLNDTDDIKVNDITKTIGLQGNGQSSTLNSLSNSGNNSSSSSSSNSSSSNTGTSSRSKVPTITPSTAQGNLPNTGNNIFVTILQILAIVSVIAVAIIFFALYRKFIGI